MKILDIYSDEVLVIVTEDKKYVFCNGDSISITMIDGITLIGTIEEILSDSVVISSNTSLGYKFEKISFINN